MTGAQQRASALTIAGVALGAALVPLNSTMIAVALPRIADDFGIRTGTAGILITVYLAAMLMGQPVAGQIADRYGRRRTATVALLGFAMCSLSAMVPAGFTGLVAARGGQAVFAAALAPSVQAMLRAITPVTDHGRAFGLLGSVIGVGAAGGPVIGGVLVAVFDWQAIFAVNVPIVAVVLVVLRRAVPPDRGAVRPVPARSGGSRFAPLANPVYVACFATQSLSVLAQYTLLLVAPIMLDARGWGSGQVGLALSALTVGMIVTGPIGGRAGDRVGRKRPVLIGLGVALAGLALSVRGGHDVAAAVLIVSLAVFGVGHGLATPGLMAAALESVPDEVTATAAGVFSTSRYTGSIVASVVLSIVVDEGGSGTGGLLVLALVCLAASVVTATRLPGPVPRRVVVGEPV